MSYQTEAVVCKGGLDIVSAYLQVANGRLIAALNYEALAKGGYRKIDGYALYDGRLGEDADAVPGEGRIRGVWSYKNTRYAFRNNVGSTAGIFWKSSGAGWVAVDMTASMFLEYDGGTAAFSEGDVITGFTSGATATVQRVVLAGGDFTLGTAYGLLVLSSIVGVFLDNEPLKVATIAIALANGTVQTYAFPPDGDYEFVNNNFFGQAVSERMYGVNGVGDAFEFDGTFVVPIRLQSSGFYPVHVTAHKQHLMLGYAGGSVINSATGKPTNYSALEGAAEIAYGTGITNLKSLRGGNLLVGGKYQTFVLTGSDSTDFQTQKYNDHGIRAGTVAEIAGAVIALDDLGLQSLQNTQAYGDYNSVLLSVDVAPAVRGASTSGSRAVSVVAHANDQYRLFFGKNGFYVTFDAQQVAGIMPVSFLDSVYNACRDLDADGKEILFFGSDDGKVFKFNETNYFNAEPIFHFLRFPFIYEQAPKFRKRYKDAYLDMRVSGADDCKLSISADYDFNAAPSSRFLDILSANTGNASWNQALWNTFTWSAAFYTAPQFPLNGIGENMSMLIAANGEQDESHTIYGVVIHYSRRRMNR